jgi:hypothetical protein
MGKKSVALDGWLHRLHRGIKLLDGEVARRCHCKEAMRR